MSGGPVGVESEVKAEIRRLTRRFAEKEILPLVEADEHAEKFRPEIIKGLGELGLTGVPVPEAYGGAGMGYSEYAAVIEELSAVSLAYGISVAVTGLPQMIIANSGTEAQKQKYIPKLAAGLGIGAFGLSEAGSGSDAASLRTQAKKVGDTYVINGTKLWITQADICDVMILMARTSNDGAKGVSAFIIEKGDPGFKLGKREKKMAMHISHTMEVVCENLTIPADRLIGKEGEGFKVAMSALDGGRVTIAAAALGVARGALDVAISHAQTREQFGKPIGEFQGISFMLADMATQLEAARGLVEKAASLRDAGLPYKDVASMAKLFATDAAMKITTDAVQILGGSGYTQEFPVERYMREAKVLQIVEGTNQVQRLLIGRTLLSKG